MGSARENKACYTRSSASRAGVRLQVFCCRRGFRALPFTSGHQVFWLPPPTLSCRGSKIAKIQQPTARARSTARGRAGGRTGLRSPPGPRVLAVHRPFQLQAERPIPKLPSRSERGKIQRVYGRKRGLVSPRCHITALPRFLALHCPPQAVKRLQLPRQVEHRCSGCKDGTAILAQGRPHSRCIGRATVCDGFGVPAHARGAKVQPSS
jgi:hypothetical protein